MKILDGGAVIVIALIVAAGVVAFGSSKLIGDDNVVEEALEVLIEDKLEDVFFLPEDALSGKVDVTPWSIEAWTDNDDFEYVMMVQDRRRIALADLDLICSRL